MSEEYGSGLPFALIRWIKANQEDIAKHNRKMAIKNWKDDCDQYMKFIGVIVSHWAELKIKDRQFIMNLVAWHNQHKNFSVNQRSAIASMYMKYLAKQENVI